MPKPVPTPIIRSLNEPSAEVLRRCWRVLLEGEERTEPDAGEARDEISLPEQLEPVGGRERER